MDTKKLRQKILDLAIHGKLVPQDPNDEPASVLLERIRAEKERLIKEGKIKRSRKTAKTSDTPHYENVPFEVPENWEWTTLGEIGTWQSGATPSRLRKDYYGGNIPWLKTGDLNDGLITDIPEFITQKALDETSVKLNPIGSILIAMYGATIGKIGILTFPATTNQACCACSDYKIEQMYLFYFLLANKKVFIAMGGGGAQPNISKEKIAVTFMPLPPLTEQQRIVVEIERWFKLIDAIDQSKADLQTTITQTKSKILDLAIHGKLVPQDPNDEPASELLKRINPKAQITCDNEHNGKLPPNWTFTKIKNVFEINPKTQADDNLDVAFVPMANISDGYRNLFTYDKRKWRSIKSGFTHFQNGDIAVAKISPCLENRKSVVFSSLPNGLGAGTTELHIFRSLGIDVFYALYFFKTNNFINQCVGTFNGVVGQQRIGKAIIENISFPLPPLSEQKRIVCKIEDLFSLINIVDKQLEE
ncbi:restriction endonuclease subunit S [Prevotella denticola]|uniref:restriction endonuclease subunit S n=1 Tax=Prevotella denticola TaxID=28129 RepID=UPI00288AD6EB|nr:restriction endonuclease subunit S [Prevotella denticola]